MCAYTRCLESTSRTCWCADPPRRLVPELGIELGIAGGLFRAGLPPPRFETRLERRDFFRVRRGKVMLLADVVFDIVEFRASTSTSLP